VGLQSFERRLERMVEGVFARAFRSGVRPIELGRRLVREMDDRRSVDVKGRTVVPNSFVFWLSPRDREQFADIDEVLLRELSDAAREYAREEGYSFLGPVHVELKVDDTLKSGRLVVEGRMDGGNGAPVGALVLPSGERFGLGERVVVIGRLPECEIVLSDPNVSRRHAEIHPSGASYALVDLGSTNGTKLNGVRLGPSPTPLHDGDEIVIGTSHLRFEAS